MSDSDSGYSSESYDSDATHPYTREESELIELDRRIEEVELHLTILRAERNRIEVQARARRSSSSSSDEGPVIEISEEE